MVFESSQSVLFLQVLSSQLEGLSSINFFDVLLPKLSRARSLCELPFQFRLEEQVPVPVPSISPTEKTTDKAAEAEARQARTHHVKVNFDLLPMRATREHID